jgi:hypothetical protein
MRVPPVPPAGCAWRRPGGRLDPNQIVNAWGGPTYIGAMAAHYLDAGLVIAAAACVLNWILLPAPAEEV